MKNTDTGVLAWLGFRRNPDWSRARWLGAGIGVAAVTLGAGLLILTAKDLTQAFLRTGPYAQDGSGDGIRNSGLFLVALLGAPFLIWRTVVAQRQVDTAEASLLNDKIRDAATGLAARREVTTLADKGTRAVNAWEDDILVRVAAIDTLEGLAEETPPEARRIERLLASYVRGTFPAQTLEPTEDLQTRKVPRLDLQAAVSALGRVHGDLVERGEVDYRLDLKACDFDGVDFSGGNFFAADLSGSRMEGAILIDAVFDGAKLIATLLNWSVLLRTNFRGCNFNHAVYSSPNQNCVILSHFNLANDLDGASFVGANFSAIDRLGRFKTTFGSEDTVMSSWMQESMPSPNDRNLLDTLKRSGGLDQITADQKASLGSVSSSSTPYWSGYHSSDGAIDIQLSEFYEALDMKRWPYWEGP